MCTLLGLSTQSLIVSPEKLATFFRIVPSVSSDTEPDLHLTDPSHLFTSLKPAEHIQLPNLPPIDFLHPWKIPSNAEASLGTVADPTLPTTASIADSTVIPSLRIPVTTRKPGQDHHFADDDVVQYEVSDGVQRLVSNRQTFEYKITARKPTEIALKTVETTAEPAKEAGIHITPPLFHFSNEQPTEINSIDVPDEEISSILKLPQIPVQPFYVIHPNELVSRIQALPFEDNNVHTILTVK